jgi:hypothetical protein
MDEFTTKLAALQPWQWGVVALTALLVVIAQPIWDWRGSISEALYRAWLALPRSQRRTTVSMVSVTTLQHRAADYVSQNPEIAPDAPQTPGLSVVSSGLSASSAEIPDELADIMTYRTREKLIDALVAAGWGTGEIRALIKGDSGVIGEEVKAARTRLGIDVPQRVVMVSAGKSDARKVVI